MKKYLIYLLIFTIIFFVLPALCTRGKVEGKINSENKQTTSNENVEEVSKHNYTKYGTIKLLHKKTGEIEEIPIDEYLYGTVSAEMPVKYEIEALKAQAIVSRTYTIYQIEHNNSKHGEANICDDSACCQAWISKENRLARWEESEREGNWNKIVKAVNETSGKIATYNNEVINAFFHSNSGGKTEIVSNVWGGSDVPYLQSVEAAGENNYEQYSSEVKLSKEELINKLKEKYEDIYIDFNEPESVKIIDFTVSGRVKTIKFGNKEISGTEARKIFGLKSTNFSININENDVFFYVTGYGHGVGMSQTGADSMAKSGSSCDDIIKHFYTGVEIVTI